VVAEQIGSEVLAKGLISDAVLGQMLWLLGLDSNQQPSG